MMMWRTARAEEQHHCAPRAQAALSSPADLLQICLLLGGDTGSFLSLSNLMPLATGFLGTSFQEGCAWLRSSHDLSFYVTGGAGHSGSPVSSPECCLRMLRSSVRHLTIWTSMHPAHRGVRIHVQLCHMCCSLQCQNAIHQPGCSFGDVSGIPWLHCLGHPQDNLQPSLDHMQVPVASCRKTWTAAT